MFRDTRECLLEACHLWVFLTHKIIHIKGGLMVPNIYQSLIYLDQITVTVLPLLSQKRESAWFNSQAIKDIFANCVLNNSTHNWLCITFTDRGRCHLCGGSILGGLAGHRTFEKCWVLFSTSAYTASDKKSHCGRWVELTLGAQVQL